MNSRGIYTALVAIIVIAAIGGTFLYLRKPTLENGAEITARSVREVRMAWENARIVMDDAVGQAMADKIKADFEAACGSGRPAAVSACSVPNSPNYFKDDVERAVRETFKTVITDQDFGGEWNVQNITKSHNVFSARVNFGVTKKFGENEITYNIKKAGIGQTNVLEFGKRIGVELGCTNGALSCKITATDYGAGDIMRQGALGVCPDIPCTETPGDECKVTVEPESTTSGVIFNATPSGGTNLQWQDHAGCWENGHDFECTCPSRATATTTINATATITCDDALKGTASGSNSYDCPKDCVVDFEELGTEGSGSGARKVVKILVDGSPPRSIVSGRGVYKESDGKCTNTGQSDSCTYYGTSGLLKCDCSWMGGNICEVYVLLDADKFTSCNLGQTAHRFNIKNPCT